MDSGQQAARITLKTMCVYGFDYSANRVAKVRNVSRLGSHTLDGIVEKAAGALWCEFCASARHNGPKLTGGTVRAAVHRLISAGRRLEPRLRGPREARKPGGATAKGLLEPPILRTMVAHVERSWWRHDCIRCTTPSCSLPS